MSVEKFFLYLRTIYYLKPIQIRYRIYYAIKKRIHNFLDKKYLLKLKKTGNFLHLPNLLATSTSYVESSSFTFLNLTVAFENEVDWNYGQNGKLWTYNLNYFDFLMQEDLLEEDALKLMKDFATRYNYMTDGLEPYPTSIRIVNWVKFISKHQLQEKELDTIIYSDLTRISKNLEYHLLGNHLLENAFAILFGGAYFQDQKLLKQAEKTLKQQLEEQVLPDGGHFELSPMYHQTILAKLLDCINILAHNSVVLEGLQSLLQEKAQLMFGWLINISFQNGNIPHLNDSTDGVSPPTSEIQAYAKELGVHRGLAKPLKECGYRKFDSKSYEAIIDVGNIGPDYIPGHAHSDTFNILLNYQQKPILVDTGISTYEKNTLRQTQRCTAAHNTVTVAGHDQSEVWGGFRVGRRAKCVILEESEKFVSASHSGFENQGIVHSRSFEFEEKKVTLVDELNKKSKAKAYFHFHPDVNITCNGNVINFGYGLIEFKQLSHLDIHSYEWAYGFNRTRSAQVLEIGFDQILTTTISFL